MLGKVHSPRRNLYGPVNIYIIHFYGVVVKQLCLFLSFPTLIFFEICCIMIKVCLR